ncbi:hypothetical protein HpMS107_59250 [Helicobacter pylori]
MRRQLWPPTHLAALPQLPQNFASRGSKVPHRLHGAGASELPHCWQKRAPWALTVPQLGQWTPAGLCGGKGFP